MKVVSIHKPQFLTFYILSAAYQRTWKKLCWGGCFLGRNPRIFLLRVLAGESEKVV